MTEYSSIERQSGLNQTDEISISDMLLKLWAKRGLLVILPLVFAGLTTVALLVDKTSQQTEVSLYVELNGISLRDAIDNGGDGDGDGDGVGVGDGDGRTVTTRYPNGTVFSPQDLTNPSVLRMLAEQTGLDAQDLAQYIDVQFGTPISNGVLAEYKAALSANSKASAEDLAGINERYKTKLAAASKRGLKVTVDYVALNVPKETGALLAEKLLQLWNQVYTEQFVTLLPSRILGLRWTNDIHDLTTPIGLQEASGQIDAVEEGIDAILADGRIIGLLNVHDVSATDIKTYLNKFRQIYFEPLFLAAFESDSSLTRIYERDIAVQMKKLDAEIVELNARLAALGELGGSRRLSGGGFQDSAPSLDGGAFSQVISLAEQASLSKYIEASLEKKYELIAEKAELQARLERMRPDRNAGQRKSVTGGFIEKATERYVSIITGYDDMFNKAREIAGATTPSFYSITTQPATEGTLIAKRDLLFLALATALGGMLAVIVALVWPTRQSG